MTCNLTAAYKSFVNENASLQETIGIFSLCYVFQALDRYLTVSIPPIFAEEVLFEHFVLEPWHAMHLRCSASMRLDCIDTHKF